MEYIETQDNDTHHYVIPFEKREEWNEFCELDPDDEKAWEVPEWAVRIDRGRVIFKEYRIG